MLFTRPATESQRAAVFQSVQHTSTIHVFRFHVWQRKYRCLLWPRSMVGLCQCVCLFGCRLRRGSLSAHACVLVHLRWIGLSANTSDCWKMNPWGKYSLIWTAFLFRWMRIHLHSTATKINENSKSVFEKLNSKLYLSTWFFTEISQHTKIIPH